jgi:anti-sigma regulatory factor (Ser/Thr protein kinase)
MNIERATAHFAGEPASAGPARRFISDTVVRWGCPELEEVAVLLVSELVANVALHAAGDVDLVVTLAGNRLRVEVHDASPALPQRKHYSSTAATGRGLALVEELADTWGAEPSGSGKQVWFELDRLAPPRQAIMSGVDLDQWDDLDLGDAPPAGRASGGLRGGRPAGGSARARSRGRAGTTR